MSGGRNLPIAYMWCILIIFSMTCDNSLAFLPTISTVGNSKYDTTPSPYILARQSMFSKSSPLLNMAKLPTPEESAKQLTEYMAKAHEEKLKAVAAAESKSQARIQELTAEVASLKDELDTLSKNSGPKPILSSDGTYEMPVTNRELTKKLEDYQRFLTYYIPKTSIQRYEAVSLAEKKIILNYENKIANLEARLKKK
eukprot:CAMPEP_0184871504 /NCGR_PEP_ID=MMETSP0580-20130426/40755_1 /TAXON_ID=1118495 /ORGANISM="Dactyliosolen fragilissimus" /LENGTH=197 /DNA_ID=CAMNT_0027374169 /DNA_START=34 /DNA_END=627 /DNA_ORIENTATION=+